MITLLNGDCLEEMKKVPDKSVDLIICDLPYGCLGRGRGGCPPERKNTQGAYGGKLEWDVKLDLEPFWTQVRRIRRNDKTPTLHFCTTKFGFDLYASNPSEFRYDLVWNKQRGVSFLQANKMPMRSHEMIYVFAKKGAAYTRVNLIGEYKFQDRSKVKPSNTTAYSFVASGKCIPAANTSSTERCPLSVIDIANLKSKGNHPTEKPIDLYKFLLERYCPKDGTVLDPTFGSGNSGRAALALGFNYIGIEKDKKFFDKAKADLIPSDVPIITHVTD